MKLPLFILSYVLIAHLGFAETPLHTIALKDTNSFKVASGGTLAIYPLSERAKPLVQKSRNRPILAADYQSGTTIATTQPKIAAQEILRQISEQTQSSLGSFSSSSLTAAEPAVILMAASESSVWHVILTPKSTDTYALTVSFLIDEKKAP